MVDNKLNKTAIQKALECVNSPTAQTAFEAAHLPATQYLLFEHQSLAERVALSSLGTETARLQGHLSPEISIAAQRAMEISERLRIDYMSPFAEAFADIAARQAEANLLLREALRPYEGIHAELAEKLATIVPPLPKIRHWASLIEARVGSLNAVWLSEDVRASVLGFTHMSRLSESLRVDHPFSPPVVDLYEEEFGEVVEEGGTAEEREDAAIEAGFNPGLIAFPSEHFGGIMIRAGFQLHLEPLPIPRPIENDDPTAEFNSAHRDLIEQVEHRMRLIFIEGLTCLPGGIKGNVEEAIQNRWRAKREDACAKGRPILHLIYYADFTDFAQMADRKLIWSEILGPFFLAKEDMVTSLRRLSPIRNDLAHTRPIGRSDQFTLVYECTRILSALGLKVLA